MPGSETRSAVAPRGVGSMRPLIQFVLPYRWRFVFFAVSLVGAAAAMLAMGQGLRQVIDKGLSAANVGVLNQALNTMVGLCVLLAAATYVRMYNIQWLETRVAGDIRRLVFSHVLTLSPAYFDRTRTGDVSSRLMNGTATIEMTLGGTISQLLRGSITAAGALVMLSLASVKLTGFVLLVIPLVLAPVVLLMRRVQKLARSSQDRVSAISSYVDETLHAIRTVQAYGHEPHDRVKFAERVESHFSGELVRMRHRAGLGATLIVLAYGAISAILWAGGQDVLAGRVSPGSLTAFIFYSALMVNAVTDVSEGMASLHRTVGATTELMALLETAPEIRAPATPTPLPVPGLGAIRLDNVTFHYQSRPDIAALNDFSLDVKPGERIALVGPSGAGKSTVFQLLLRYYDPQQGRVLLDGVDVAMVNPAELRNRIAVVSQDPVIFADSVLENVRYGRPDATDDEVRAALDAAYAAEFVARLPEGEATYLGERGVRLSGGQRQRIAIARAILADRPLLLLDEATSALDSESERMVQLAVERLAKGRTSIVIAHRLSTVQNVDRIAVLEHGRLVSIGTQAELVREGGLYARLAAMQLRDDGTPAAGS